MKNKVADHARNTKLTNREGEIELEVDGPGWSAINSQCVYIYIYIYIYIYFFFLILYMCFFCCMCNPVEFISCLCKGLRLNCLQLVCKFELPQLFYQLMGTYSRLRDQSMYVLIQM